jgi:hypothetical protein
MRISVVFYNRITLEKQITTSTFGLLVMTTGAF